MEPYAYLEGLGSSHPKKLLSLKKSLLASLLVRGLLLASLWEVGR